ncbi:hypothetical protein [Thauera phenylacetica]|uniref:hypothetical protein n=1 Tax=Thauera phenylacetica TaxID=164400 RepID=UPI0039E24735
MSTNPTGAARPLRDQIVAFLQQRDEATAKEIIAATTEAAYPSRVLNELNKLRTDAVVECEVKGKKKGNGALWYWLAMPANTAAIGGDSQPAVEQNTGSSAAGASATQPAGAAVHPKPAPAAAASPSAAPVAADDPHGASTPDTPAVVKDSLTTAQREIPPPQYDPDAVAFKTPTASKKARPGAAAKKATQNRERILLGEIAAALGAQKVALAKLPDRARSIMVEHDRRAFALVQVHDALAERVSGEIDPSDLDEVECAQRAAVTIDEAVKVISAAEIQRHAAEGELAVVRARVEVLQRELDNQAALTEKLEHLLQSARNEAEHLRTHTGTAAAVAYAVLPTTRAGEVTDLAFDRAIVEPGSAEALDEAKRLAKQEIEAAHCEAAVVCALVPVATAAQRVVFEPA